VKTVIFLIFQYSTLLLSVHSNFLGKLGEPTHQYGTAQAGFVHSCSLDPPSVASQPLNQQPLVSQPG